MFNDHIGDIDELRSTKNGLINTGSSSNTHDDGLDRPLQIAGPHIVRRHDTDQDFVFPSPFDTSLGSNFTNSSCVAYFHTFLSNKSFIECYPMSFYLENSQSYVDIVRQGEHSLTYLLDTTCAVDTSNCQNLMNNLASELVSETNCGHDYSLENQLVVEAYDDFLSYSLAKETTCLAQSSNATSSSSSSVSTASSISSSSNSSSTNASFSRYCYVEALYNPAFVDDAYLYLLAVGVQYPNTSSPSCTSCTQRLMALMYAATSNSSLPISNTYDSAASIIDSKCGAGYVKPSASHVSSSSSHKTSSAPSALIPSQSSAIFQFLILPLVIAYLMHFSL